jgi:uncharacterized RDD family membrane protein YckC
MNTAESYIAQVLARMPRATPRREQIGSELRSHIAERLALGHSLDHVLAQLGDPAALADSYLAEIPLASPHIGRRITAKLVDVVLIVLLFAVLLAPIVISATAFDVSDFLWLAVVAALIVAGVLSALYTILAEWWFGQTVGKHLLGLRVVRESGGQIGLGQSIVRQLPAALQVYWLDVLFALFTEHQQRAFEVLSKTRVVRSVPDSAQP